MQPARKVLLVFQGFVRDLTLVNTHYSAELFILLFDCSSLMVIFLQDTEHCHLQLNLM